jgi:hypothetical protein
MKDHAMPATQCSPEQEAIRQKRQTDPFRARMQPFSPYMMRTRVGCGLRPEG